MQLPKAFTEAKDFADFLSAFEPATADNYHTRHGESLEACRERIAQERYSFYQALQEMGEDAATAYVQHLIRSQRANSGIVFGGDWNENR